ncbi:MAG: AbrB/MazE/SpoVT family DNA-binding domain-containing protein [Thermoplasmata archaeon]|nr:AbrB/MazE/SpoVT family DNA-binding domain-containing protein [Candidatus Sysuiplasma acidicola]
MSESSVKAGTEKEGQEYSRRVQRAGLSSLSVTLPKTWIESTNLRVGDVLVIREVGEGRLEIQRCQENGAREFAKRALYLDIRQSDFNLASRLIIGAYITGHDTIILTSKDDFTDIQKREVDIALHKTLGMSMVEESPTRIELQNFTDPVKYRLSGLLERVSKMLMTEIYACKDGLMSGNRRTLDHAADIENEIDKFYLLMTRQLLLSSDNYLVAKEIGVESHHYQLGYRLVAKALELIGDMISRIATEIITLISDGVMMPQKAKDAVLAELDRLATILSLTTEAFNRVSAADANSILNEIEEWLDEQHSGVNYLIGDAESMDTAASIEKIISMANTAFELLVTINETTINRFLERERLIDTGGHITVAHDERKR